MPASEIDFDALPVKATIAATDEILVVSPSGVRSGRAPAGLLHPSGSGGIPVSDGGTGATDAAGARSNLSVYSKAEMDARWVIPAVALTPSQGTISLNGNGLHGGWLIHAIDGNVIYQTVNLFNGLEFTVQVNCDPTNRTLTFPVGWKWIGGMPTGLDASKTGAFSIRCNGATNADIVAAWSETE